MPMPQQRESTHRSARSHAELQRQLGLSPRQQDAQGMAWSWAGGSDPMRQAGHLFFIPPRHLSQVLVPAAAAASMARILLAAASKP